MSTDSMVARVVFALLLLGLVGARPTFDWERDQTQSSKVTPWSPLRAPVALVRDTESAGYRVTDKGALFGFNSRTNQHGRCNSQSSHECYCETFTDNVLVGRGDSVEWFIIGVTSAPVKRIAVWAEANFVTGVQVSYFDGSVHFYGRKDGIRGELSLYASERIIKMSIWDNSLGRIGGISFTTSRGGFFKWGATKWEWGSEIKLDVASGLMMNIFGLIRWSDNTLFAIGFDFLRTIVTGSGTMVNMNYVGIPVGNVDGHKSLILRTKYENKAEFLQKYNFQGSVEVVTQHGWEVDREIRFDNGYNVFGIKPELAHKDGNYFWELGQSGPQARGSTTEDRDFLVEIKIPPHKNYYAEAWLYDDTIECDFVANIEFTLTSKATYKLMSFGKYRGKTFRKVFVNAYEYSTNRG